jgi:4-diphosphocytidyl-2-C-methyl-D-erythritol kinase
MPELRELRLDAFAKLTLSLRITGARPDGYHELDGLMVTVTEPHDVITMTRADSTSLTVTGPHSTDVPHDASNLVWRAAEACGGGWAIILDKQIPAGAGLGGGSADAAALLVALGAGSAVGARLGADVPFCMRGGAARVRGVGDVIEPVDLAPQYVVVATPTFRCATAEVYRAWDALGGPHAEPNDLEPAAHHVEPRLVAFKRAVEQAAEQRAVLAGSGSSYAVVLDDDPGVAHGVAARVGDAIDGFVWLGRAPASR